MKSRSAPLLLAVGVLFVLCAGVWSIILAPAPAAVVQEAGAHLFGQTALFDGGEARVAALLAAYDAQSPASLDAPTKTTGCAIAGPLPDHGCTPGSVFAGAGTSTICVSGYTKRVRNVPTKLRLRLFAAYGIAYPQPTGSYELDHLVPLALGGDNSAANLFPEAAAPKPGFREKDVVEVYLYENVCAGRLPLAAAQKQIAEDWTAVYTALDQSEITRLKQKYSNWSN